MRIPPFFNIFERCTSSSILKFYFSLGRDFWDSLLLFLDCLFLQDLEISRVFALQGIAVFEEKVNESRIFGDFVTSYCPSILEIHGDDVEGYGIFVCSRHDHEEEALCVAPCSRDQRPNQPLNGVPRVRNPGNVWKLLRRLPLFQIQRRQNLLIVQFFCLLQREHFSLFQLGPLCHRVRVPVFWMLSFQWISI